MRAAAGPMPGAGGNSGRRPPRWRPPLLIDYVLTVAVSVVAGVAAITSAVPALADRAVALSLGFVVVLTVMNLRGVKESGRAFAVPTYGFVVAIYALLAVAFAKIA